MTIEKAYRRLRRNLDRWMAQENSTRLLSEARRDLAAALAASDLSVFRGEACMAAEALAAVEGQCGNHGVLNGIGESWSRINASCRLEALAIAVNTTGGLPEVMALVLGHLYCIGERGWGDRLGRAMYADFVAHHSTGKKSTYTFDQYASLALYLWAQECGDQTAAERIQRTITHDTYGPVVETWKTTRFEPALLALCDYHVTHAYKDSDDFAWSPYDLLPTEILWLDRLRSAHNLLTPAPRHILLDSPLYSEFRDHAATPVSPEVGEVITKLCNKIVELGYPTRFTL